MGKTAGTEPESELDAFAALLRELKSRTGRSYGVLAKRLHVSTSTLHRYCNGDAVPTDFAPAERFARLCGAAPEELVELHRRWILADAARGQRAQQDPAAVAVRAEADPPASVPAQGEGPPGPRGPSRRKVPAAVLAGAVAALVLAGLTVVVLTSAAPRDGGGSDSDLTAAHRTDRTDPAGPRDSAGVEGKKPGGKPTGHGDSARSPGASGGIGNASPSPGAEGGSGRAGNGAAPLSVHARPYTYEDRCDQSYLIDRSPSRVPPPPTEQDTRGWATALGGVPAGRMKVALTVQGTARHAVVLEALHVRMAGRHEPLGWSSYSMGAGCGSGITPPSYDVDLDRTRPQAEPVPGARGDKKIPAESFPYKVSADDPEVLEVHAGTEGCDCRWYLELEWSSGRRHGMLRVDDRGQPFRTSAAKGRPLYAYWTDREKWRRNVTAEQ